MLLWVSRRVWSGVLRSVVRVWEGRGYRSNQRFHISDGFPSEVSADLEYLTLSYLDSVMNAIGHTIYILLYANHALSSLLLFFVFPILSFHFLTSQIPMPRMCFSQTRALIGGKASQWAWESEAIGAVLVWRLEQESDGLTRAMQTKGWWWPESATRTEKQGTLTNISEQLSRFIIIAENTAIHIRKASIANHVLWWDDISRNSNCIKRGWYHLYVLKAP